MSRSRSTLVSLDVDGAETFGGREGSGSEVGCIGDLGKWCHADPSQSDPVRNKTIL